MSRKVTFSMILVLLLLCGCSVEEKETSQTRFILDTVATVTAQCDDQTVDGAFLLCEELENKLSRTKKNSDVYKLNETNGFVKISEDTLNVIEKSLYYSELSGGKFDITICPVSMLWDFKNRIVPSRDEISKALDNVDYHSVSVKGDAVSLGGGKIDLGAVAKGYIADKMTEYLINKGVKKAVINLGGNVSVIGSFNVGIQKPFEDGIAAEIDLTDCSAVTSGIYQRFIKKDGKIYHHIIDPSTGYGVENELASVTVIGKSSADCDALSTVCMLCATEKGAEIIEKTDGIEAVFIDRSGKLTLTSGLYMEDGKILFKRKP